MIARYETEAMKAIWSDENRFLKWLDVEIAASQAWMEQGHIPEDAFDAIKERASFSVERIAEIEAVTHHDVIAFVSSVAETVGEYGRYVHLGLTSSDVIDTAASLLLVESVGEILSSLERLQKKIGTLAWKYRKIPSAGRTHGVHAEPTSFGLKLLNNYAELGRNITRLEQSRRDICIGKLSGAVGTYANAPSSIERRVCELLELVPDPVATQVIQRDRHAQLFADLAICAGGLERLATEVRHLQRTELREASEPFAAGQKGSSAMPHKKNPILCERVCGMSRLIRGYALSSFENLALWHERDISHSSVERVIWPDAFHVMHYMILTMDRVMTGLQVSEERLKQNLNLTEGLLFSGRILTVLVESGISREDAYAIVQENAMKCWETSTPLLNLLRKDSRLSSFTDSELESYFDISYYLRHVDEIFARFPEIQKINTDS